MGYAPNEEIIASHGFIGIQSVVLLALLLVSASLGTWCCDNIELDLV